MRHGTTALSLMALGAALSLCAGCEGESKLNVVVENASSGPQVNLPTVPTLPPPPPLRSSDGAFTVYGLRHQAARDASLWGHSQRVHGYIVSVYTARNDRGQPCAERDRCVEERPHVYIADARDERDPQRMMMVTGYATFQHEIEQARADARANRRPTAAQQALIDQGAQVAIPTDFDEGAEVTVEGNFTRRAANGQADSNGLIEYRRHTTTTPAPPPARPGARR